ncbi:ribosome silencing factor, partial [Candidatus Poribacteria bacterium]
FAIFSGASDIQVEGISEAVVEELEQNWQQRPWHREGARKADWILLDYVDFVVHIFLAERRDYYNLERLWAEAERVELPVLERTPLPEPDAYDEDALILGLQEE